MSSDLDTFREETRAWLEENCPPYMRTRATDGREDVWGGSQEVWFNADAKLWFERMVEKGWTAPTWPKEYGGGGLTEAEGRVLAAELRRIKARMALKSFGLWMLGPVLLEYGTQEQKQRWLPGIVRGETSWCQGYSEPGAGSDLAGLSTRAELQGDQFVINGQKIWTSRADKADWMFCLVRTDPDAPKREGISFVLIEMTTPGVSVRPIELISGASPFCETFLDNVKVPKSHLVGPLNGGWTIAKKLLEHERAFISAIRDQAPEEEETLPELAREYLNDGEAGELSDPILRDQLARAELDHYCYGKTMQRSKENIEAGRGPGPETSMFKYYGTELNKRKKDLRILMMGYQGLGWEGEGYSEHELERTRQWLRSRANSIEGGSSEIQLNIIAKRVLGLPD